MKRIGLALAVLVSAAAGAQELTPVTFVTNWFAEPEHGGFYAALKDGLYEDAGLDVSIMQGGPQVSGTSLLAAGRVQLAMSDAAATLFARNEGVPVVAIYGTFQTLPQGLMYHEEAPLNDFADLAGRTVTVAAGAAYWDYIESKYDLAGKVQVTNYNGQIAEWLLEPDAVTQIYVTSEPYAAEREGAKPAYLEIADSGFNPYANIVTTTEQYLADNPDVIRAFVDASREGWQRFLADPAAYTDVLAAENDAMTEDFVVWSNEQQRPYIETAETEAGGLGVMSAERWQTLYTQLADLGLLEAGQDVSAAFSSPAAP